MKRIEFKMKLFDGCEDEYKKRHDAIWPELKNLLKETGIQDYSIFLDRETNILFGVLKVMDESKLEDLPRHPVMKKWWASLTGLMETNDDTSPKSNPLQEVFYLK